MVFSYFPTKILYAFLVSVTCATYPPPHSPWVVHSDNIWWSVPVMKLLIKQSSPATSSVLVPDILLSNPFSNTQQNLQIQFIILTFQQSGFWVMWYSEDHAVSFLRRTVSRGCTVEQATWKQHWMPWPACAFYTRRSCVSSTSNLWMMTMTWQQWQLHRAQSFLWSWQLLSWSRIHPPLMGPEGSSQF